MADRDNQVIERKSYRRVYRRLWSNEQFRSLIDGERVVTLYVFTGPQTNRIGLFRFSVPMAAEDLARPVNTIRRQFDRVREVFDWEWDATARVLWIPGWWKYNPPPKQDHNLNGALTDLNDVPRTALISKFCNNLEDIPEAQQQLITRWQSLGSASAQPELLVRTPDRDQTETRRKDSAAPQSSATPSAAVIVFSTVGERSTWPLTEAQIATWQRAYPSLDVAQECRGAAAWLEAKPSRRKTFRGMPAFLVNWLNRSVDRGGGQRPAATAPRPGWERKASAPARECPHVDKCGSPGQCANALQVDPHGRKFPLKAASA